MAKQYTRRDILRTGIASGLSVAAVAGPLRQTLAANRSELEALRAMARRPKGRVILPGDAGYEAGRQVWNFRFDRRPSAIVRCLIAGDVARVVDFARKNDMLVAVRSGGHSQPGFSVCNSGIVIDLFRMKRIAVDAAALKDERRGGT